MFGGVMDASNTDASDHPQVLELCRCLGSEVTSQLKDILSNAPPNTRLKVEASVCGTGDAGDAAQAIPERMLLGYIDLKESPRIDSQWQNGNTGSLPASSSTAARHPPTPESMNSADSDDGHARKRRKVVGGLRLSSSTLCSRAAASGDADIGLNGDVISNQNQGGNSYRQVHTDARFPPRKPPQETAVPTMEPTSGEKLISGIWRQIFSEIRLTIPTSAQDATISIRGAVDREVFKTINAICMKYYSLSHSARATEMVVQAYWVECYEARIEVLKIEKPFKSMTEVRMEALKEACATFNWKEKELRNKLSIWRAYRDIKEAGGWVSLIFASTGVYRFCKYRTGFDEALIARLRQLRPCFEAAADTLHPEWRQLLDVISQCSRPRYSGHPHQWVIRNGEDALPLTATYPHIPDFDFQFIEEPVLDADVFGDDDDDPRKVPGINPYYCLECGQYQSNNVHLNRCMCYPSLYGNPRSHPPVQVFRTSNGKNNGVVSRCLLERGTAIAEFVGQITRGIVGMDVMIAGSPTHQYQIYQGKMGNFTRFINHSCRSNCQFQTFCWLGVERIIVVSRGVSAGSELTVDYSDNYWKKLEKKCLCGESCCRYP